MFEFDRFKKYILGLLNSWHYIKMSEIISEAIKQNIDMKKTVDYFYNLHLNVPGIKVRSLFKDGELYDFEFTASD